MSKSELLGRIVDNPTDRRKFMQRAGAAGLGVAALTMMGGNLSKAHAATTVTDVDILNFALNLEYLEAEFYGVASFGATLQQRGIITDNQQSGPTRGGNMVPDFGSAKIAYLASAIRDDETEHVLFLRKALGSSASKKPTLNLDALGFGFANMNDFLRLARVFEDVGVSAYLGAAPLIKSSTYLDAAARILATEAQHSGSIRDRVISAGLTSPAADSKDIPPTTSHPFFVDSNGLSIPRSTSEVLNIVYGGGAHSGGFYPAGLNGTIK